MDKYKQKVHKHYSNVSNVIVVIIQIYLQDYVMLVQEIVQNVGNIHKLIILLRISIKWNQ